MAQKKPTSKQRRQRNRVRRVRLNGHVIAESDRGSLPQGSRSDTERFNRAMGKVLQERDFQSSDEMMAFLNSEMTGKTLDEILGETPMDAEEQAQDLAYQALSADSFQQARELCQESLKLDPNNIDAQMLMAMANAKDQDGYIRQAREIIAKAEERFGPDYMEENMGHFWGLVETRPYMRARADLLGLLMLAGRVDEAILEAEGLLELNPGDNQGIRDQLLGLYLQADKLTAARDLLDLFKDAWLAVFNWGHVLERVLSGKLDAAQKACHKAQKQNDYVVDYLLGQKRPPDKEPDHYSPGDETEAIYCYKHMGQAWQSHPEAVHWLKRISEAND